MIDTFCQQTKKPGPCKGQKKGVVPADPLNRDKRTGEEIRIQKVLHNGRTVAVEDRHGQYLMKPEDISYGAGISHREPVPATYVRGSKHRPKESPTSPQKQLARMPKKQAVKMRSKLVQKEFRPKQQPAQTAGKPGKAVRVAATPPKKHPDTQVNAIQQLRHKVLIGKAKMPDVAQHMGKLERLPAAKLQKVAGALKLKPSQETVTQPELKKLTAGVKQKEHLLHAIRDHLGAGKFSERLRYGLLQMVRAGIGLVAGMPRSV